METRRIGALADLHPRQQPPRLQPANQESCYNADANGDLPVSFLGVGRRGRATCSPGAFLAG